MKITASHLKEYLDKRNLSIAEFVRQVNALQKLLSPGKRPITRNAVYHYFAGHTPTYDKIYLISAVLKTHPKKIFDIIYDESLLKACLEAVTKI